MKTSTGFALVAGGVATAIGIAAAFLCPIAGIAAGAYFTWGAVSTTMSTAPAVALTLGGAVGGFVAGRIAAPIVAIGAIGIGALVGGVAKGVGFLFDKTFGFMRKGPTQKSEFTISVITPASKLGSADLTSSFDKAGHTMQAKNDNAAPRVSQKRDLRL